MMTLPTEENVMQTYTVHIIPAQPSYTDRGCVLTITAVNKYHACRDARRHCVHIDGTYGRLDGRLIVTAQREG